MTTEHKPHSELERADWERASTLAAYWKERCESLVEQYEELNRLHANGMFLGKPIEHWEGLQEQLETTRERIVFLEREQAQGMLWRTKAEELQEQLESERRYKDAFRGSQRDLSRVLERLRELQEQLEAMREALELLRDGHDEHDSRCASLFEPPSRPMECDCELGIIEDALAVVSIPVTEGVAVGCDGESAGWRNPSRSDLREFVAMVALASSLPWDLREKARAVLYPHSVPDARQSSVSATEEEVMQEPCPVCLYTDWEVEYDYNDEGDEIEQLRCQNCGWPPVHIHTVEEWRRHHFISPYLKDLEAMVADRDERIKGLVEQLEATQNDLAHVRLQHQAAEEDFLNARLMYEALQREKIALEEQVETYEARLNNLSRVHTGTLEQNVALEATLTLKDSILEGMEKRATSLEEQLETLRASAQLYAEDATQLQQLVDVLEGVKRL